MLAGSPAGDRKRRREEESNSATEAQPSDQTLSQNKQLCVQNRNGLNGIFQSLNFWSGNGNNSNNNIGNTLSCDDSEVPTTSHQNDLVSGNCLVIKFYLPSVLPTQKVGTICNEVVEDDARLHTTIALTNGNKFIFPALRGGNLVGSLFSPVVALFTQAAESQRGKQS